VLRELPELEFLGLSGTQVTDGLFSRLASVPNLQLLLIEGTAVSNETAQSYELAHPGLAIKR
jgi:hypothetical protein